MAAERRIWRGACWPAWFRLHPGDTCHLCDPLAMAAAIDPQVLTCRVAPITVDTANAESRGETRFGGTGPAVRVATQVDTERFFRLFDSLLLGRTKTATPFP